MSTLWGPSRVLGYFHPMEWCLRLDGDLERLWWKFFILVNLDLSEIHRTTLASGQVSLSGTTVCGQDDDIFCIQLSLSSSGGERVHGNTQFPAVEAHTEHRVLVRRDGGPIVPPPPDPGDLAGKYGVQAPAKDFEATLLGSNPTPGDSDQVMLSKDRSPRSESICLVKRSSSCDTGSNARLAMKGSVQQSSVNRPVDSEHAPVIPGPGSGLMTGTGTWYPVHTRRF